MNAPVEDAVNWRAKQLNQDPGPPPVAGVDTIAVPLHKSARRGRRPWAAVASAFNRGICLQSGKDKPMTRFAACISNARMSQAVIHGDTVYLAGQVAQRAGGASVADQTRDILARIDELLAEAGTDKTKLLSATIWLADVARFAEMNEIRGMRGSLLAARPAAPASKPSWRRRNTPWRSRSIAAR